MTDFEKMYFHLFNAASDAIELVRSGQPEEAEHRLIAAQQECEKMYVYTAEDSVPDAPQTM